MVGFFFLCFIGAQSLHHIIEINEMSVKFWSVYADKFCFVTNGYPASAAHACAVNHDCVERDHCIYAIGAGGFGADVSLAQVVTDGESGRDDWLLFSESNGRYLAEVSPDQIAAFEELMDGLPFARIGQVSQVPRVNISRCREEDGLLLSLSVKEIRRAWRGHLDTFEAKEAVQ